MELRDDIFVVKERDDRNIIYAPLRNVAFFANQNATDVVQKYIDKKALSDDEKETKVWEYLKRLSKIERVSLITSFGVSLQKPDDKQRLVYASFPTSVT